MQIKVIKNHNWDEGSVRHDDGGVEEKLNGWDCFGLFNILLAVRIIFLLQQSQKCLTKTFFSGLNHLQTAQVRDAMMLKGKNVSAIAVIKTRIYRFCSWNCIKFSLKDTCASSTSLQSTRKKPRARNVLSFKSCFSVSWWKLWCVLKLNMKQNDIVTTLPAD